MNSIDEIYLDIAQHCTDQIEDEWNSIKVEVEYFVTAAEFDVSYQNTRNDTVDLNAGYNLFKLFQRLHALTTENSEQNWNKGTFTLEPKGDFNMEFEWDQELADEIEQLDSE